MLVDEKLNMTQHCVLTFQKGLHQKQRGQQIEGGDSALLLCSGETPPRVLRSAVEPSAQERHGPVGVGPEEGHKNDLRDGAPLLRGKAERDGVVHPAQEWCCSACRRADSKETMQQPSST